MVAYSSKRVKHYLQIICLTPEIVSSIVSGMARKISRKQKSAWSRKGGKIGGRRRAAALTPERRREIAILAAKARWG